MEILGVHVGEASLSTLVADAIDAIEDGRSRVVFACANPHSLVVSRSDPEFRAALRSATHVVADGVGLCVTAALTGVDVGPRITGSDYYWAVLNALSERGRARMFFLGSSEVVLHRISDRISRAYPRLTVCGTLSPPFTNWSKDLDKTIVDTINDARPDVLWVGMTAPKQEKWVERNRPGLKVPVIASVGAVFDFFAGTHSRAPSWMCHLGLEWIYRVCRQPRKIGRRVFISNPQFVVLALMERAYELIGSRARK